MMLYHNWILNVSTSFHCTKVQRGILSKSQTSIFLVMLKINCQTLVVSKEIEK